MTDKKDKRVFRINSSLSAAIAMIALMFVFGLGNRILADILLTSDNLPSVSPDALSKFPMEIGLWKGKDEPLDEAIIEATDTDAHISRNYNKNNGSESVSFYVAFGKRTRDLMPHRPEVCYIGQGYTLAKTRSEEITLDDGTKLPYRIMQFEKGTFLGKEKRVLLDYYIVDGILCRDVSLLRKKIWRDFVSLLMRKIWRGAAAVNYIAQIQVVAPVPSDYDSETTEKIIRDFAVDSAPLLLKLVDSLEKPDEKNSRRNTMSEETESE